MREIPGLSFLNRDSQGGIRGPHSLGSGVAKYLIRNVRRIGKSGEAFREAATAGSTPARLQLRP